MVPPEEAVVEVVVLVVLVVEPTFGPLVEIVLVVGPEVVVVVELPGVGLVGVLLVPGEGVGVDLHRTDVEPLVHVVLPDGAPVSLIGAVFELTFAVLTTGAEVVSDVTTPLVLTTM